MIYDKLQHIGNYFPAGSPVSKAVRFAREFDALKPDGKYEIEGNEIYAQVSSYETCPAEERRFEAHRKYIDVQILLKGEEKVQVSLADDMETLEEYSEARDITFLLAPPAPASIVLVPGYFAVIWPHEIHRPNCQLGAKRQVRKIVVKVRAE